MRKIALLLAIAMFMSIVLTACNPATMTPLDWDAQVEQVEGTEIDGGIDVIDGVDGVDGTTPGDADGDGEGVDGTASGSIGGPGGPGVPGNQTTSGEITNDKPGQSGTTGGKSNAGGKTSNKSGSSVGVAKTINVWGDGGDQTLLSSVANYEDKYPAVKVNIVSPPGGELNLALITATAAGREPDALKLDHVYITGLGERGFIEDLTKHGANKVKSKFVASTWSGVSFGKKVYGLPHDSNTIAMAYNQTLIGQVTGSNRIPRTYNEIVSIGRQAQLGELQYFFTLPFFEATRSDGRKNWAAFNYFFWLWGHGGEILNSAGTQARFNSAEGVEALRKIVALTNTEKLVDDQYRETDFYDGRVCLIEMGNWAMGAFKATDKNAVFGVSMLPTLATGKKAYSGLGLFAYGITPKSKVKKETYRFIEMLCLDKEMQRKFARQHNQLPVTKEALNDPFYKNDKMWKTFVDQQALSKARPGVKEWAEVEKIIADAVVNAIRDNSNAKSVLDTAATRVNNVLKG